jgi:hypothetical protein
LNFMNFKAGENLPTRMNLGGAEIEGTWWVTPKWGAAVEYRGEAGTTQVYPNASNFGIHRPLVYMNMGLAGVQYRWLKNQHAALDLHAYGGLAHGVFDAGTQGAIATRMRRWLRWAGASTSTGRRTGRCGFRRI